MGIRKRTNMQWKDDKDLHIKISISRNEDRNFYFNENDTASKTDTMTISSLYELQIFTFEKYDF